MFHLFYGEFTRSINRGSPLLSGARLPFPPPIRGSSRLFRGGHLFPTRRRAIRLYRRFLPRPLPPFPPRAARFLPRPQARSPHPTQERRRPRPHPCHAQAEPFHL